MNKISYIMHIDWGWIKQRPHFIAERLSSQADVKIIYEYYYGRKMLQKRSTNGLQLVPIFTIPKISRISKLSWINSRIFNLAVQNRIKKSNSDIVFITHPNQIGVIPKGYTGNIYYDCMDNHAAFVYDEKEREKLEKSEKKLIEIASKVFVSSEYLRQTISNRYQVDLDMFVLVRNAYNGNIIEPEETKEDESVFKLAYIGTISSWFDFNTVIGVLKQKNNVEFHLFGPIDRVEVPNNPRIIYHGVVEHEKLYEAVKYMNCLIMPFVLNEIIEAVDPVKVYEYINFNKNIIIRKYPEVDRLNDFVYFYNNIEDFIEAIERIEQNRAVKYSMQQRNDFLRENSWDKRVKIICNDMGL